jgi:hypothetical protein
MAQKKITDLTLRSDFDGTVNLAGDDASQTYRVTGAQIKAYIQAGIADLMRESKSVRNLGLAASVSGNALTIALKTYGGSADPSSSAPVEIGFRGTTAGNGDFSLVQAVAATSLVVSSGSTLGTRSGLVGVLYVYALNNGGTVELAVSSKRYDEGSLVTTTAEGGAGAADSETVIYSTTARTSKAIRLIGRLTVTEATAGTWASAPSEVSLAPFDTLITEGVSTAFTPTFNGFGTVASLSAWYVKLGKMVHIFGRVTAGTVAASTASMDISSLFTIDSARLPTSTVRVGSFIQVRTAVGPATDGALLNLFYDGSDTAKLYPTYQTGSNVFTKLNGNGLLSTGDSASFDFWVPVL